MKSILKTMIVCVSFSFTPACTKTQQSELNIYNPSIDNERDAVGHLISNGRLWCSATLIEEKTLLSAGHCFEGRSQTPDDLYINFNFGEEKIKVLEVIVHPQYSEWLGKITNDVAVLKLEEASNIRPETLSQEAPEIGRPVLFVGYGKTDAKLQDSINGTRRRGTNVLERVERLKIHFPKPQNSSMSQVCKGDSGGPVFAEGRNGSVQIGIVSGSLDRAAKRTCNVTSYAARVDAYYDWIMDQI